MLRFARSFAVVISSALTLFACRDATAQSPPLYTWDGTLSTSGTLENAPGPWNLTDLRWYDGSSYNTWSSTAIAQFGATTSNAGAAITVDQAISLAGLNFLPVQGGALPSANLAYSFTGTGSLNFAPGSTLSIASGSSNGSSGFIRISVPLVGSDLTLYKPEGGALGYLNPLVNNPNLTGTLTLRSAPAIAGGIYLTYVPARFTGLSRVAVEAGSTLSVSGTGAIVLTPLTIAGTGGGNWGAIRVDGSNTVFSSSLTLSADARVHSHINTLNMTISGSIGETAGGSKSFTRTAFSPINVIVPLTTTYSGTNTYTGSTNFGRLVPFTSTTETTGTEGGLNILDFTNAAAPDSDIFYNNVTPGAVNLFGGISVPTIMRMNGALNEANSQTFGSLVVQQGANAIELNSSMGGSATMNLGDITRTDTGVLAVKGPGYGAVTATAGGAASGFIGAWATYTNASGTAGGWAGLTNGVMGIFTGTTEHVTATTVPNAGSTHLRVSSLSNGDVTLGAGVTNISTLSMTDTAAARLVDIGAGKTLRVGAAGGLQIVTGAKDLTVSAIGDGSTLTAGATDNTTAQLLLTNMSATSTLTINTQIKENGSGSVALLINGTGRTVLTGANSFTGLVAVDSGVLEVRNNLALGTAGTTITKVVAGASLNLAGDITLAENLQINGHGIASDGALRSLSGTNTVTPVVRVQSSTRISADSGTLILTGGMVMQNSSIGLSFSGKGDIDIRGAITGTTPLLTKEGSGTLTLTAASTPSITTISNGVLNLNFAGTGAPADNILATGGTLTFGGGALRATGKSGAASNQTFGLLTLNSGYSTMAAVQNGASSLNINFTTITRNVGSVLRFDLPTTGNITTTGGANNVILTGTGGTPYATVGLNEWAATDTLAVTTRNIVTLSSLSGYTASTSTALAGNADIALGTATTTLSAAATAITSLRFNQAQLTTIAQDVTGRILTTGGVLVTPAVGANESIIATSILRSATSSTDIVILQNNTAAALRLKGRITNNASGGATALTKSGPGLFIIEAPAVYATGDYSGATRIQDGALQIMSGTGASLTNAVYASTTFTMGSGANSGKLVLGSGAVAMIQYGGLRTEGSGTTNSVVGGASTMSTFLHYIGTNDFRNGFIGGPGTNENNLNLTISLGVLQLGPANTFKGKTIILQNTLEVQTLANTGFASSLGTGDFNAAASIIEMGSQTTGSVGVTAVATLRYAGSTNSSTNRVIFIGNSDVPTDITSVTAILENTGTGTVKFTSAFTAGGSNTATRTLRLDGTNTGLNEIVSVPNTSASILTNLEKSGSGTWALTGNSTYTGTTIINDGVLQLGTGGTAGNVGGSNIQFGSSTGVLRTSRSNTLSFAQEILGAGSVQINNTSTGITVLTRDTSTYSGGTTVNSGTLAVANVGGTGSATGSGPVTVNSGGVLAGNGRITAGPNQMISILGGTLQIGDPTLGTPAAGLLTLATSGRGGIVLGGSAILAFDLISGAGLGQNNTANAAAADLLVVVGTINLGTGSTLRLSNPNNLPTFAAGDQWKLFDWTALGAPIQGTFTSTDLPGLGAGLTWDLNRLYTDGVIAVTSAVPEPSRALLILISCLTLAMRRRRRQPLPEGH